MKRKLFSTLAMFLLLALAVVAAVPESRVHAANPSTGRWSTTGSMSTPRSYHTATLLPNGNVLVAGGGDSGFGSTAELYDPRAGTWSSTGSLSADRSGHTATLLPNGKVLVAGGWSTSNSDPLATAELYNPKTGTWSKTGSMSTPRDSHTATLLPNGKVLVAGDARTAELYDPRTGTWSKTGSMSTIRSGHTATLLPNGKVLVAGGVNGTSDSGLLLYTAELYTPSTGTWSKTSFMSNFRSDHTATLLPNGKVLVAGSMDAVTAELYTPRTNSWSKTGSMFTFRSDHTATLLPNGKVLVAGGDNHYNGQNVNFATAELYDPKTGTWSKTGSMSTPRDYHTATLLLNGKVLVTGGDGSNATLATAELFSL